MTTVALIGNPNVGKTVVFNALTGARQSVANFPGVTVEKKTGTLRHGDNNVTIVDLPGVYSLTANSLDERIAREFIIEEKPDLVVDILDSSNLDRNLYLALQLRELGVNMLLVANMTDIAARKGITLDIEALSSKLGVPVIQTTANKSEGIDELKEAVVEHSTNPEDTAAIVPWLASFASEIGSVKTALVEAGLSSDDWNVDWVASALIEGDEMVVEKLEESGIDLSGVETAVEAAVNGLPEADAELAYADARYQHIFSVTKDAQAKLAVSGWSKSEMMDEVLTHKVLGIPIFITVFWGVFQFVFGFGDPFIGLTEYLVGLLSGVVVDLGTEGGFFTGLVADGIIGGVGGVLVFLPIIGLLFIAIGVLEDSGYLARVAFIMDKLMTRFGLNGQAIVPMLLGFGCNIPGVMATRTIKSEKERLTSICVNGFISCGARLPIYVLIAGAMYSESTAANVTLLLYLIGMVVALLAALVLRKTYFKGESAPFIMELPPYLIPTAMATLLKLWQRCKGFLLKAGSIVLISTMVIFTLDFYGAVEPIGKAVAVLFWWMDISWEFGAALLFGLIAKEVVVGALGTLMDTSDFDIEDEEDPEDVGLRAAVKDNLESNSSNADATTMSYLVFSLLYVPCFAALGAIRKETNSWKMTGLITMMYIVVAYVLAALTMGIGALLLG